MAYAAVPADASEKDFLNLFPESVRASTLEELSRYLMRQVKSRRLKRDEAASDLPPHLLVTRGVGRDAEMQIITKVPVRWDGLRKGDVVGMALGGSGDLFASALSRRAEAIGASILRIPPSSLKAARGESDKEHDAELLARLVEISQPLFHATTARDRDLIMVRECLQQMMDAMKARIACEQRLRQRLIGRIFCNREGLYPEGQLEDLFAAEKASDPILQNLIREEMARERDLTKALDGLHVYTQIFKPVEGCGPRIAARLIASIMDIRRFRAEPDGADLAGVNRGIKEALAAGKYYADKPIVAEIHGGAVAFEDKFNGLERIGQVAKWQREQDKTEEPAHLQQALELMRRRSNLHWRARCRSKAKLRMFCGVGLDEQGRFLRRRAGQVANWSPDARQALYLLAEQFNRRPTSAWGLRLREYKVTLRARHPNVECSACGVPWEQCQKQTAGTEDAAAAKGKHAKRYTNGHIHKMALWRTVSKFVEWLYDVWTKLDQGDGAVSPAAAPQIAAAG